jgi:hypothetical protein
MGTSPSDPQRGARSPPPGTRFDDEPPSGRARARKQLEQDGDSYADP